MQNMHSERISEIQRLRVLADLLELIGAIEEDNLLSKEEISDNIRNIIVDNFLHEPTNIYKKGEVR